MSQGYKDWGSEADLETPMFSGGAWWEVNAWMDIHHPFFIEGYIDAAFGFPPRMKETSIDGGEYLEGHAQHGGNVGKKSLDIAEVFLKTMDPDEWKEHTSNKNVIVELKYRALVEKKKKRDGA